jgi:hypothetical protein
VFVRAEFTSDGGVQRTLVVGDLASGREQVLIPGSAGMGLYAPAWAPDGRTIVFAGQGPAPAAHGRAGQASPPRHGGTWDLWTVPAAGGQPRLLSAVQEDLPWPHWTADGRLVLFLSPTGLWQVPATGGPPLQIGPQTAHTGWGLFAPLPRPAAPLAGPEQCFPATGQCLRGLFLRYWQSYGGLAQLGYPIGAEQQEEGRVVQYTQRARLEWHPENAGTPYEVLLGRLGADQAGARAAAGEAPFARHTADPGGRFFPETGQTLAPPFRAYWERQGGLPVFGYPLSAAFREVSPTDGKPYLVQYFERNRLEYHPEYAGTPAEILLGLLGVQEWQRRYQD